MVARSTHMDGGGVSGGGQLQKYVLLFVFGVLF